MSASTVVLPSMTETAGVDRPKAAVRYRYGRHETFAVRHGWLTKALRRIGTAGGDLTPNLETADALGLGSKMVQSLQFWTEATGLVEARLSDGGTAKGTRSGALYDLSPLGRMIEAYDPFMEYPATWWFLHMELSSREGTVWSWFFNHFDERHFDRNTCTDAFLKHTHDKASNPATPATAQRDVACLLAAYSSSVAILASDDRASAAASTAAIEEEGVAASPLRDLGLVLRHEVVNRYERVRGPDRIPSEVFLSCVSRLARRIETDAVGLSDLARSTNGPGRILCLGSGALEKAVDEAVEAYAHKGVGAELLGAELHVVLPPLEAVEWLELHYERIGVTRS